jgi:prophage regulatory protein
MTETAMWRLRQVMETIGLKKSTIWARVKAGLLPPPVRIGERAVAWPSGEICRVIDAYIAGCGADDVKALVRRLVAERKSLLPDSWSDR